MHRPSTLARLRAARRCRPRRLHARGAATGRGRRRPGAAARHLALEAARHADPRAGAEADRLRADRRPAAAGRQRAGRAVHVPRRDRPAAHALRDARAAEGRGRGADGVQLRTRRQRQRLLLGRQGLRLRALELGRSPGADARRARGLSPARRHAEAGRAGVAPSTATNCRLPRALCTLGAIGPRAAIVRKSGHLPPTPAPTPMYRLILVPVDGSGAGTSGLDEAIKIAKHPARGCSS